MITFRHRDSSGIFEDLETARSVEEHGQRWGHQWTATATLLAEHPRQGTIRLDYHYMAMPGYGDEFHPREGELKNRGGGEHLNTGTRYREPVEWQDLPAEPGTGELLVWVEENAFDRLEELVVKYFERMGTCEECGRATNFHDDIHVYSRVSLDDAPLLCGDCFDPPTPDGGEDEAEA